jgi:hypothetical protein
MARGELEAGGGAVAARLLLGVVLADGRGRDGESEGAGDERNTARTKVMAQTETPALAVQSAQ